MTRRGRRLALVLLASALLSACVDRTSELPYYDSADFTPHWTPLTPRRAPFTLLDQRGQGFTDRDLTGKVHVVSFIYTRCSVICPALVANLKRVGAAVDDPRFRIVSFSVTPELDPPDVLDAFGRARDIDATRWTLATGDKGQIYRLAREVYFASDDGLRQVLAERDAVLHTEKLVLVDAQGRMRGVYDGTLPRDIEHVIDDARVLLDGA